MQPTMGKYSATFKREGMGKNLGGRADTALRYFLYSSEAPASQDFFLPLKV